MRDLLPQYDSTAADAVLVLLCFADGYHALASVPLVPERRVCLVLATDYVGKEALNLHRDDEAA